jgi:hypothetical protein
LGKFGHLAETKSLSAYVVAQALQGVVLQSEMG